MTTCGKDLFSRVSYDDLARDLTLMDKTYITSVYEEVHGERKPFFYIYNNGNWNERFVVLEHFLYELHECGLDIDEFISKDLVIKFGEHELCSHTDYLDHDIDEYSLLEYVDFIKDHLLCVQGEYYGCDEEDIQKYRKLAREEKEKTELSWKR